MNSKRYQQYRRFIGMALFMLPIFLFPACDNSDTGEPSDKDSTKEEATASPPVVIEKVPYAITVKQAAMQPATGLHSFAFAEYEGKWLIVGGRKDGFHRTSALGGNFTTQFANADFYVIDPAAGKTWSLPLPEAFSTFLRSSNMEFCQDNDTLYMVGGYGSNCPENKSDCYGTYSNVSALLVSDIVEAVVKGDSSGMSNFIITTTDPRMQVTGGGLRKIGDNYYLVFGQNYKTEYKAGVTGQYTEQVAFFQLASDFNARKITISNYQAYTDPSGKKGGKSQYHRRDLNVVGAVRPDKRLGITVYGGVFDSTGSGWTNPIYIDTDAQGTTTVSVDGTFAQKTNQYECAQILMFDPATATMYTTFLGGIGLYEYVDSTFTPDPLLPFVNIISTLARRSDGSTLEYIQPSSQVLPKLIGANAIFVPADGISSYSGEIIDYSKLPKGDSVLIGYFYGGILAFSPHTDEARPTQANNIIYEVWLSRNP